MTPEESPEAPGLLGLGDSVTQSLYLDGPKFTVSDEVTSSVVPSLSIRRSPFFPDDLVDSDSASEESDDSLAPKNACPNEEPLCTVDEESKVGRWTYSKGSSRKPSRSRISKPDKSGNIELHRESQRLLRETNIELIEHRPKQFNRFSEFRLSLHGGSSTDGPSDSTITDAPRPLIDPVREFTSEPPANAQVEGTELELLNGGSCTDPVQPTQSLVAVPISKLLPIDLPPVVQLGKCCEDEDVIDLGEALPSEVQHIMTPADYLMARLKKHVRNPSVKVSCGPIEYSVVTKVVDENNGTEQLRAESVTYEMDRPGESMTGSQGRQRWRQHRELLREQMRQRRLEQYEARLKEAEHKAQVTQKTNEQAISDEDDCEWSEGEDVSSYGESSTSSSTASESNGEEDDDLDDDVVVLSRRPHTCAFADDEAEESGNEDGDESYFVEPEDEGAFQKEESRSRLCPFRSATVRYDECGFTCEKADTVPQFKADLSALIRTYEMDEFTDLPTQTQEPPRDSGSIDDFCFTDVRKPQGSLGPGDVDLFVSDYSTVLDRPLNVPSVLTSTRLDTTIPLDNSKLITSQLATETPSCSNWNNTPYELLFSQKPISQPSSLSKDSSLMTTDNTEPHVSASQDTVLLSPASDAETTLRVSHLHTNSFQESQEEHARRHKLFATASFSSDYLDGECFDVREPSDTVTEKSFIQELEPERSLQCVSPKEGPADISTTQQRQQHEFISKNFSGLIDSPLLGHEPTDVPVVDGSPFSDRSESESMKPVRRHRIILEDDEDASPPPPIEPASKHFDEAKPHELNSTTSEPAKLMKPPNVSTPDPLNSEDDGGSDEIGASETEDGTYSDEQQVESESDEEETQRKELLGGKPEARKIFLAEKFLDEEAELSGDENERAYYMDGDEDVDSHDEDLDDMELLDDENLPSVGRLRRQVERVHHRLQADQDQRELRFLKELYFEDGDLHAENGRPRERRFRWRGLENDDPLVGSLEDVDDDQSSDGAEATVGTPLGPMDRWLKSGVMRNSHLDEARHVDLDASIGEQSQNSEANALDGAEDAPTSCEIDEEKENINGTKNSVLSIGRKAVLKVQTQECPVLFMSVNKNISAQPRPVKNPQVPVLVRAKTLTDFFQRGTGSTTDANNSTGTNLLPTPCPNVSATSAAVSLENRGRISKCGSLLARVPLLTRCATAQIISDAGDTDPVLGVDEDSLSNCSQVSCRQSQVHFLGLRNKVGMSCFSVLSQPVSSIDQPSSHSKLPADPLVTGKRPSTGPNPSNVKRQRSTSVFSALL